MSSPHVIVSATHKIANGHLAEESDYFEFWDSLKPEASVEREWDHNDELEPRYFDGTFHSAELSEDLNIEISYHSGVNIEVGEIIIEDGFEGIEVAHLEEVLAEINNRLDPDFTLEVYYWYDGVDRPGGRGR